MTISQQLVTIALCVLATLITRFLPFLVFSSKRPTPAFVRYLGDVLPGAIFGLLIVYCLKDVRLLSGSHGLPEALALAVTVLLHLWKKKLLLSMAAGTLCYMTMIHWIF